MRYILALTLPFAFGLLTDGNSAHAASIAGSWAGKGFVQSRSGSKETVRCSARYNKASGKSYGLSATCTTAGGKTQSVRGSVTHSSGNRYAGRLSFAGTIRVTISGNRQTLTVSSAIGSGRVTLVRR